MKKGSVFTVLEDAIDCALIHHTPTQKILEQMEEDMENGIDPYDEFEEAADQISVDDGYNDFFLDQDGSRLVTGDYNDDDVPIYSMSPADQQAAEYMNAYYEITHGEMSIGDMIDIISGSK